MVVYLTGMHSSGTSLTAFYLHHCGIDMRIEGSKLAECLELRQISHSILNDSYIHRYAKEFDYTQLNPSSETIRKMETQIKKTIIAVGNKDWGWKAPINSLCIWKWIPTLSQYIKNDEIIIIHVIRHPAEVVDSFLRRKKPEDIDFVGKDGNAESRIENIWYNYAKSVMDFENQNQNKYKFLYVSSRDFIKNPRLLTKALDIKYKPLSDILDKSRLKSSKQLIFRNEESQELWQRLNCKKFKLP
jgi:hypothetical protein